jgi:hypothetical protein
MQQERDSMSIERSINLTAKRTLAKAAVLEKYQTHPPTRTCAILRVLIGGIYLAAGRWLGQRNCIQI